MAAQLKIHNAIDFLQKEHSLIAIPTLSQSLDKVLGHNGLQLGILTELLGLPGTGKTQICLQLCASVQIPKALGGLEGEALYIDTNSNFSVRRFKEILLKCMSYCQMFEGASKNSVEDNMKKLHYANAMGIERFCAFMLGLPSFVANRPKIKLIVIDSITFPFKDGVSVRHRTGLLFRLMAEVQKLAVEKQIAVTLGVLNQYFVAHKRLSMDNSRSMVILTNEMSTRLGLSSGSTVGAFGDAWAHRCNVRAMLTATYNEKSGGGSTSATTDDDEACSGHAMPLRNAFLLKSNVVAADSVTATFQITDAGIRDVD